MKQGVEGSAPRNEQTRKAQGFLFNPAVVKCKALSLRGIQKVCLKAGGHGDSPIAQATFSPSPEALPKRSTKSQDSVAVPPREGVGTRHIISGRKGNVSVAIYNSISGEGRRCMPRRDAFLHLTDGWAFSSSRNLDGAGLAEQTFRTDAVPRQERPGCYGTVLMG